MRRLVYGFGHLVMLIWLTCAGISIAEATTVEEAKSYLIKYEKYLNDRGNDLKIQYGDIQADPSDGSILISEFRLSGFNRRNFRTEHTVKSVRLKIDGNIIQVIDLIDVQTKVANENDPLKFDRFVARDFDMADIQAAPFADKYAM